MDFMLLDPNPGAPSPFHAAELAVQTRVGVAARADAGGRRGIRDHLPEPHREFFAELPWLLLGGLDGQGQPWATVRWGAPGFVTAPASRTLRVQPDAAPGDPLLGHLQAGAPLGLLGIAPHTRRRNRVNGVIAAHTQGVLEIAVQQSFGNCAKYIQSRTARRIEAGTRRAGAEVAEVTRAPHLGPAERALLARSDTFFIASAHMDSAVPGARGADMSHRGGPPGFIRVNDERTLTVPDFAGNAFFNTLGNLSHDPRAGLLFIDFENGDLLHVAAHAEIIWDGPEVARVVGAQRLVRFHVREVRRRAGALPFSWSAAQLAPQFAAQAAAAAAPSLDLT
jgi:predicted pyridoxine 5'-phosphate oxidase superfamily flavin-nucleotide-binding protein